MKTSEGNKKLLKNQGGILKKITHISVDNCSREPHIKVVLGHSTLTLWPDMKTYSFEYS